MVEDTSTQRIVFVCRANQGRSPLAATLLTHYLSRLELPSDGYTVSSAGTDASEAAMVIPHMRTAAAERGIDLSAHRACALDRTAVANNDLILTMTEAQRGAISRLQPRALSKTFTLKEIVRLSRALGAVPGRRDLRELTIALHRHRALVPASDEPEDIQDPDGFDLTATAQVAAEIDDLVRVVAGLLARAEPNAGSLSALP